MDLIVEAQKQQQQQQIHRGFSLVHSEICTCVRGTFRVFLFVHADRRGACSFRICYGESPVLDFVIDLIFIQKDEDLQLQP